VSALLRWRALVSLLLVVAGSVALAAAIASPRTIAQRIVYVERDAHVLGPTPPPCNGELLTELDEHFDTVIPPALPPSWVAANVIGPPPLWVTSNSGVPM